MHAVKLHSDHVLKLEIIVSFYTMMTTLICPRPDRAAVFSCSIYIATDKRQQTCARIVVSSRIVSYPMWADHARVSSVATCVKPSCRGNHIQINRTGVLSDHQTVRVIVSSNQTPRSTSPARPICSSASLA